MRFAVDWSLGKLARKLRMAGFNTTYPEGYRATNRYFEASGRDRIIVTRTRTI